jgi:hypothetical protein
MKKSRRSSSTQRTQHIVLGGVKITSTQSKERHDFLRAWFTSRMIHAIPNAGTSPKN